MTREEAKEYFELEDDGECVWIEDTTQYSLNEFIDKIFDDFEQQNEELQARVKEQTKTLNDYADAIYAQAKHIEELGYPKTCDGCMHHITDDDFPYCFKYEHDASFVCDRLGFNDKYEQKETL